MSRLIHLTGRIFLVDLIDHRAYRRGPSQAGSQEEHTNQSDYQYHRLYREVHHRFAPFTCRIDSRPR